MSGGSRNYICYQMEEELAGRMYDPEINELVVDVIGLAYSVERAESGDTDMKDYRENVRKFKNKWFKQPRKDRLKKYIDESLEKEREDLYLLIGEKI